MSTSQSPTTNIISEQSQNPSQAGATSTSISKDVGDAPEGKELQDRLETIDGTGKAEEGVKVGDGEGDQHERAAERQP